MTEGYVQGHKNKYRQNTRYPRFHLPNNSSFTTKDNFGLQNLNSTLKFIQKTVCFMKEVGSWNLFACERKEKYAIQKCTLRLLHQNFLTGK